MRAFDAALAASAAVVEATLAHVLPKNGGPEARVFAAMRYATLGGGKRLRPFLVIQGAKLFGVPEPWAARAAAAVELVHCYSLVHDDLPAMDDDELRRGRPTCHIEFDEATAILAGDGLLTLAFEVLAAEATHPEAAVRVASSQHSPRPRVPRAWWADRCATSRPRRAASPSTRSSACSA